MVKNIKKIKAKQIMNKSVISIKPNEFVREAIKLVLNNNIGALPVVNNENKLLGLVSKTDIVKYTEKTIDKLVYAVEEYSNADAGLDLKDEFKKLSFEDIDSTKVKNIMKKGVFSISEESKVGNIINEMDSENIHRIFITNNSGELVGIISTLDIIKYISKLED